MGLIDVHNSYIFFFAVYLKHSSFWPPPDATPMFYDLAHAMSCTRKDCFQSKSKFITEDHFTKHVNITIR